MSFSTFLFRSLNGKILIRVFIKNIISLIVTIQRKEIITLIIEAKKDIYIEKEDFISLDESKLNYHKYACR